MSSFPISSAPEQVANHLREQLMLKAWVNTMLGGASLARELTTQFVCPMDSRVFCGPI
jgi:hypothetical protein